MRATTHVYTYATSLAELTGEWRIIALVDKSGDRDRWIPCIPEKEFTLIFGMRRNGHIVTVQVRTPEKQMVLLAARVPPEIAHLFAHDAHLRNRAGNLRPHGPSNRHYVRGPRV